MALLGRDSLFRGLRAIAKKLRRRQSSSSSSSALEKRPRSSSASTPDHSRSSSSSSSGSSYRNDIRRVFAEYDADADGRISLEDLTRVVTAIGSLSSPDAAAEAAAMMEAADLDRDGYIGFEEFQALMTTTTTTETTASGTPPQAGPQHPTASVRPPGDADAGVDHGIQPQHHGPCASTSNLCDLDPEGWPRPSDDDEDIRLAFAVYDHDGDGVITAQEIHAVLRRLMGTATNITLADCRRMVQAVDRDGDGVVGFHDFAAMMMMS